jgi:hypothetical protein
MVTGWEVGKIANKKMVKFVKRKWGWRLLSTPILKTIGQVLAIAAAVATRTTRAATASASTAVTATTTTTAVSTTTAATTVSTTTTAVTATAATGGTFFTRARDVDGQATTGVIFAVHACDRGVRLFRRRHSHEREAARATCNAIGDQGNVSDGTVGRKGLFEFIISGGERKVPHIESGFHCIYVSLLATG